MLQKNWFVFVAIAVVTFGLMLRAPTSGIVPVNDGIADLSQWQPHVDGPVVLSGNWHFYPNQLLTPDRLPTNPSTQFVPGPWQLIDNDYRGHGYGTYALTISGLQGGNLGLIINPTCGSNKVFVSSAEERMQTLSRQGQVGTSVATNIAHVAPELVALPEAVNGELTLVIQVGNYDYYKGGLCSDIEIGSVNELYHRQNQRLIAQGLIISAIFSVALYAFGMFFQSQNIRANLWLGLWALVGATLFWSRANLWEISAGDALAITQATHYRIEYIAVALLTPAAIFFYHDTFQSRYLPKPFVFGNLALVLLFCGLILFSQLHWQIEFIYVFLSFIASQLLLTGVVLVRAVIDKKPSASILLASLIPMFVTVPMDFALRLEAVQGEYLSQYSWVFFIFMHILMQGNKMSASINQTEMMSAALADEVARKTQSLEDKNRQLLKVHGELQQVNEELQALSVTDSLTGAHNRLYFDRQFEAEWNRSRREREPFSLIMLDIDHFKCINDEYGHLAGDQCLKSLANWLHMNFRRANDMVCRYGGEEFVVLLPNTKPDKAVIAAEHLRHLVADTPVQYKGLEIPITVSIGVSGVIPGPGLTPTELFKATDDALYSVKRSGRNGVRLASIIPQPVTSEAEMD